MVKPQEHITVQVIAVIIAKRIASIAMVHPSPIHAQVAVKAQVIASAPTVAKLTTTR
jgi:hypothetical protein